MRFFDTLARGGSRGTSNNGVGEQNSNYLLGKTKIKAFFALLHRCSTYPKSASASSKTTHREREEDACFRDSVSLHY